MDNFLKFSKTLRRIIQKDGRNQRELAEAAGITPVTLSRWLSGTREPRAAELQQLADALQVAVADLTDNPLTDEEGLTVEDWKERALRAEAQLAELKTSGQIIPDAETCTAEEYLTRLLESMRFVFHFITQDDTFKK